MIWTATRSSLKLDTLAAIAHLHDAKAVLADAKAGEHGYARTWEHLAMHHSLTLKKLWSMNWIGHSEHLREGWREEKGRKGERC